ncbi:ABC transporter permease [Dokdonia ponticola]|uniref:Transport permease protein n=1 Tax=Dokdonia ponticola TaxID=2041041 RepID=A0ABV9I369_9FLAO
MNTTDESDWLYEISPKGKLIDLNFKEIWRYRDLLWLFVKRDIVTVYKQTILGPLWFFIQPLFTSVIFTLVFNNIASINTGIIPSFLFNLAGITMWSYFKLCLNSTSNTFRANQSMFGKVYFPRVIVPLSKSISNLFRLGIQLLIFIGFYVYFVFVKGEAVRPSIFVFLAPFYFLIAALFGMGLGMIISSMTTKYRDLNILVGFAVQLLMYVSAVPYPLSVMREKQPEYVWLVEVNPITQIIEGFRYLLFQDPTVTSFNGNGLVYTTVLALILFFVGLIVFNRTEKKFIDTV